jgi:hypothetical protein
VTPDASPTARLAGLLGEWTLARTLEPGIGTFHGRAVFVAEPGGIAYREDGTLTLASGWSGPASRAQHWSADDDGIDVRFAGELREGELLHRLRPDDAGRAADSHLCGADRYDGAYELGADELRIVMDVRGPEKSYVSTSVLRRVPPPTRG